RFAVSRLKREAPAALAEPVEVLDVESARLERMASDFSNFGRLLEGPPAPVDIGEPVRYAARATATPDVPITVLVEDGLPMVCGHHGALARAISNVLLNAQDACRAALESGASESASIDVVARLFPVRGGPGLSIDISDTGNGVCDE